MSAHNICLGWWSNKKTIFNYTVLSKGLYKGFIIISLLAVYQETKGQLDKANGKIREAKEETQQIRRDCQAMIKTYQVK